MTISKVMSAAAILAAAVALGFASPASAEPLDGSYTMTSFEPLPGSREVILTPCGSDCTNWRYVGPRELPEGLTFHLHGNRWVLDTNSKFSFDKDSLTGTQGMDPLPDFPVMPTVPFALTKNG